MAPAGGGGAMNIRVHIERLILDGVPVAPGQEAVLQAAVETELARLLAAGDVLPWARAGAAVPSVDGGTVTLSGAADASQVGRQVAQGVYGGISQ